MKAKLQRQVAASNTACFVRLRCRDMGTVVMGKSEAGVVKKGDTLMVMPNKCVNPLANQLACLAITLAMTRAHLTI